MSSSGPPTSRPSYASLRSLSSGIFNRKTKSIGGDSDDEPIREVAHVDFFLDNHLPITYFKEDILNLAHTLLVPRWRVVESHMAGDLIVTRISGAMTNAIYSVEPPSYLKDRIKKEHNQESFHGRSYHHRVPPKLLLRVYGPQVDHLIDRDQELRTLTRLSERKIGPRLYGTFKNGRFEQFLNALPLTKEELRIPEVSTQIAKRMRELHDGVLLLDAEREKGPSCWQNIDKWTPRMVEVLAALDKQAKGISSHDIVQSSVVDFLDMITKYRKFLNDKYGASEIIDSLVFAHNDTQYGNILRIEPPKGSPLLMPRNEHRQLVVIDFEYSGANTRGYDIANHFCEWMSDYHDPVRPYHIHNDKFPNYDERLNLIRSYVEHGYATFDEEEKMEQEVADILSQSTDWRPAVNAHWCIWGIIQAIIDVHDDTEQREAVGQASGLYRFAKDSGENEVVEADNASTEDVEEVEIEEDDLFDYLSYSTEKAELFWTDMIRLGLIQESDYHGKIKSVNTNQTQA